MDNDLVGADGVDKELVELVDAYLDGNLTKDSKAALEARLEAEEGAQDYFVARVRFHGEMLEAQQPIRVELVQKRQVVFEYDKGIPKVTTREAQATRVGNPRREKFVELVPENTSLRKTLIILGVLLALALIGIIWLAFSKNGEPVVPPVAKQEPVLIFRNPSFGGDGFV